jgi:hypothetical protein
MLGGVPVDIWKSYIIPNLAGRDAAMLFATCKKMYNMFTRIEKLRMHYKVANKPSPNTCPFCGIVCLEGRLEHHIGRCKAATKGTCKNCHNTRLLIFDMPWGIYCGIQPKHPPVKCERCDILLTGTMDGCFVCCKFTCSRKKFCAYCRAKFSCGEEHQCATDTDNGLRLLANNSTFCGISFLSVKPQFRYYNGYPDPIMYFALMRGTAYVAIIIPVYALQKWHVEMLASFPLVNCPYFIVNASDFGAIFAYRLANETEIVIKERDV